MSDGSGAPGPKPAGGGKRTAIGMQIKLPCASVADVKARYGDELKVNRLFIRTSSPRAKETLIRLEAQLNTGVAAFRVAAVVVETNDAGMRLQILGADEAGRDLIAALGGKPPAPLKVDAKGPPQAAAPRPSPAPITPRPPAARPAEIAQPAASGGFSGWLKRLFGGKRRP